MKEPLLSVVVAVYNVENYLRDCLLSLVAQTYGNIEILLVNDGSTDGSLRVAREFEATDSRIRIISKQNEGLVRTRQRGIEESKGEYVCFLDGDDYLDKCYLEKLMHAMRRHGCDCATGEMMKAVAGVATLFMSPNADYIAAEEFARGILLDELHANLSGRIYKRELLENLSWYPEVTLWEDFITNIQVALNPDFVGMCVVRDTFYYYVQRSDSMHRSRVKYEYICDFVKLTDELFEKSIAKHDLYVPERVVNMADRHYAYMRILSNPWRGDGELSLRLRAAIRDNKKQLKGEMPWLIRQASYLYPCKRWFFIVEILVTLQKWSRSFAKRRGTAAVRYSVPAAGSGNTPEILR